MAADDGPSVVSRGDDELQGGLLPGNRCEVCMKNVSRYTCPGCSMRTCSVGCVKRHKKETDCNGKRDRTAFVALAEMGEKELRSDFVFLEDTLRVSDAARRDNVGSRSRRGGGAGALVAEARKQGRGTRLRIMPAGAKRRRENTSYFDRKKKVINWRVEWYFAAEGIAVPQDYVPENALLDERLRQLLQDAKKELSSSVRYQLREYQFYVGQKKGEGEESNGNGLHLLMKVDGTPANDEKYLKVDMTKTLRETLGRMTVIEFPCIHVVREKDLPAYSLAGL